MEIMSIVTNCGNLRVMTNFIDLLRATTKHKSIFLCRKRRLRVDINCTKK